MSLTSFYDSRESHAVRLAGAGGWLMVLVWSQKPDRLPQLGAGQQQFPAKSRKSSEVDEETGGRMDLLHQKGELPQIENTLYREENESEL